FNNITDYGVNLQFVRHVLSMDTIFPDASIGYRAIHAPWLQHAAYVLVIAAEAATALLCFVGSWRMWSARKASPADFRAAGSTAINGLVVGMVLYVAGFLAIASEWFGMWMSTEWNAQQASFQFAMVILAGLLLLGQREADPD